METEAVKKRNRSRSKKLSLLRGGSTPISSPQTARNNFDKWRDESLAVVAEQNSSSPLGNNAVESPTNLALYSPLVNNPIVNNVVQQQVKLANKSLLIANDLVPMEKMSEHRPSPKISKTVNVIHKTVYNTVILNNSQDVNRDEPTFKVKREVGTPSDNNLFSLNPVPVSN